MSQHARDIFIGPSNLLLSIASIWEILIKVQLGKLNLPQPAGPYIIRKLAENRIEVLPITLDHVLGIESLPLHHRDPFDRLLIAQSIEEGWPIITADPWFARYPVEVIW
jgi:PIN domain nuclease of toxin-antitoxin system